MKNIRKLHDFINGIPDLRDFPPGFFGDFVVQHDRAEKVELAVILPVTSKFFFQK